MKIVTRNDYGKEIETSKAKKLDRLERAVLKYQESLWYGYTCVDDNTYNACVECLEELHPWSDMLKNKVKVNNFYNLDDELLDTLWEIIDEDSEDITFMLNPQGLNVELTYKKGRLITAETYGRSLGNVDLINTIVKVLGYDNDLLAKEDKVVLKGVLVLPDINMDKAKDLCNAQDMYAGVFSVLRAIESLKDLEEDEDYFSEYTDILMFVCTDVDIQGLPTMSVESKIKYINSFGLETAYMLKLPRETSDLEVIGNAVYTFEALIEEVDYKTDGIRIIPSDLDCKDVYILKTQKWGRQFAKGVVKSIDWVEKLDGYLPVLVLEESVDIDEFISIKDIPLDNPLYILFLSIEEGSVIKFIYSEEIGFLLLNEKNNLLLL